MAVESVARRCDSYLQTGHSVLSGLRPNLQTAAQLCQATSPPDTTPVYVFSDASRGGTTIPNACNGVLRTQTGGHYSDNWNMLLELRAPQGFALELDFRAFDLDDDDFIEIFDNRTAMEGRTGGTKLTGKERPGPVTSVSDTMFARFVTNKDGTSFGASADITYVRTNP
jgi:hypothetical protein